MDGWMDERRLSSGNGNGKEIDISGGDSYVTR